MGTPVAASQPLMAAGLDSLAAVELRSAISARIGIALPATVALDYPTVKVRVVDQLALIPSRCCGSYTSLAAHRPIWVLFLLGACCRAQALLPCRT